MPAFDIDSYVVAGIADHLCPWQSCYRSTQLLGGSTRSSTAACEASYSVGGISPLSSRTSCPVSGKTVSTSC